MPADATVADVVDVVVPVLGDPGAVEETLARLRGLHEVRSIYLVPGRQSQPFEELLDRYAVTPVEAPRATYGAACLAGVSCIHWLEDKPGAVAFVHADGTMDAGELPFLVEPIRDGYDLVLGSRTLNGAASILRTDQRLANVVALTLIRAIYRHQYSDLSMFRAIRYPALVALGMRDDTAGFPAEMLIRAVKAGLRVAEVPVHKPRYASPLPPPPRLRHALRAGGGTLFQILWHSTSR